MIRLSCWIGGVGCVPIDQLLVEDEEQAKEQALAPVMPASPVKRCIDADIDVKPGVELPRFVNASSMLAQHFHPADEEGESSLDEIRETWRKCREKLMARRMQACPDTLGNAPRKSEAEASCLTDAG
jgi:hypothetical protein